VSGNGESDRFDIFETKIMKIGLILSVLVNVVLTLFLVLPKYSSQYTPQGFKRFCEKEGLVNCSYNDGFFIDGEKNIYKFENGNFKWDKVLTDSVRNKNVYSGDLPGTLEHFKKTKGYPDAVEIDGKFYEEPDLTDIPDAAWVWNKDENRYE
jgi:hypothetical protein